MRLGARDAGRLFGIPSSYGERAGRRGQPVCGNPQLLIGHKVGMSLSPKEEDSNPVPEAAAGYQERCSHTGS